MNRIALLILLIAVCCFFITPELQAQCAMCKQAAASSLDKNPNSLARSLNSGILYLMAIPYILIAFIFRKQIVSLYKKWRYKTSA